MVNSNAIKNCLSATGRYREVCNCRVLDMFYQKKWSHFFNKTLEQTKFASIFHETE